MRQKLLAALLLCALTLACSHSTAVVKETIQPIDVTSTPQKEPSSFEIFKRNMMPHVGQNITVVGDLKSGKLGWWIELKDWGVYIRPMKDPDIAKMNELDRFADHTVQVTGTLQYSPEPPPSSPDRVEARPPEYFYFDVAEAQVVSLKSPPR
jgi:hypothetical protein